MFSLEKPYELKTPKNITEEFKSTLVTNGIRVVDVNPVYGVQTIGGIEVKEICTKRVSDIDHIIDELIRIKPYVVFLREVTKYYGPGDDYFHIRLDFLAPSEEQ